MRIESAKAMAYANAQAQGPAAILRQQVFAFDSPGVPTPTASVQGSNNNNNGGGAMFVLSEGSSAGQGLGQSQGGVSGKGVAVSGKVVGSQPYGLNSNSISSTYQQQQLSRLAAASRY